MANKIKLCSCGSKNCPEVERLGNGTHVITDDFGGSVTLTDEQFELLKEAKL